jgi:hypothetical protein
MQSHWPAYARRTHCPAADAVDHLMTGSTAFTGTLVKKELAGQKAWSFWSDDRIGACVSRALTKAPTVGHLAVIKYSVTVRIGEPPDRTGFHGSRNDLSGHPPVGGLRRSVSA